MNDDARSISALLSHVMNWIVGVGAACYIVLDIYSLIFRAHHSFAIFVIPVAVAGIIALFAAFSQQRLSRTDPTHSALLPSQTRSAMVVAALAGIAIWVCSLIPFVRDYPFALIPAILSVIEAIRGAQMWWKSTDA